MLGVDKALIETHGAVSEPVARAMAEGALAHSRADITVAITGIAGPGGGSDLKPVGLVHFGCARRGGETQTVEKRFGDLGRTEVRRAALLFALDLLEGRLS
jgi:nicotinamide-nucleotide amidase